MAAKKHSHASTTHDNDTTTEEEGEEAAQASGDVGETISYALTAADVAAISHLYGSATEAKGDTFPMLVTGVDADGRASGHMFLHGQGRIFFVVPPRK